MRSPLFLCLALAALGCTDGRKNGDPAPVASAKATGAKVSDAPREATVLDFLGENPTDCTFGHRGVLVDLGDSTTRTRMGGNKLVKPDLEVREHEGASWVNVRARALDVSFVSPSEMKSDTGVVVEARVRGGAAKSASVYLNGKAIGSLPLTKGETTTVSARSAQGLVVRGNNELLLRFNGGARGQHDQLAEIDWIRVGPNDGEAPYSAPTRGDAVTSVAIGGVGRRSVSLRPPGFARCTAFVPNGSILEGFIGATGGEAEAEVRVLVDRSEPRVIGSFHVGGPGDPPGWRPVSLPLGDVGTIAGIELVAKNGAKGARVAFAEARVVAAREPEAPPRTAARGAILVVLGTTSRRLSIQGGSIAMPELGNLANGGTIFEAHRATSSYASGALGSMLTGLTPREHGAANADAMLAPSVFTVAEAARQAGIVTAMFTANPTTSAPYGFARGWETFNASLPSEDTPATAVFDDVGRWLDGHKADRFFIVVHARGGHPPWDVTSEELKDLPPSNYQGSLEPKHAGEGLAKARKGGGRSFADPDRERAFALHAKALAAHDAALGALVARLRTNGRDKDTVWLVTGDVGVDAAARVPFLEDESLEEGALAVPLVLRGLPGERMPDRVGTATSGVDVARTVLEALGLPPPSQLRGTSLWTTAARSKTSIERPLIAATSARFSARWGAFAVVGAKEREVKVCNLSLDPDCVSDVRPSHPLAAEALHSLAWTELAEKPGDKPEARATADGLTSAALKVWGR